METATVSRRRHDRTLGLSACRQLCSIPQQFRLETRAAVVVAAGSGHFESHLCPRSFCVRIGHSCFNLVNLAPYIYSELSRWPCDQNNVGWQIDVNFGFGSRQAWADFDSWVLSGLSLACKPLLQGSRHDIPQALKHWKR